LDSFGYVRSTRMLDIASKPIMVSHRFWGEANA